MDSIICSTLKEKMISRYENLKSKGLVEKPTFSCAKCEDKGYTFNKNDEVIWCECKLKKDEEQRLLKSGLVDRVKTNTFKSYKQEHKIQALAIQRKKAVDTCLKFLKDFKASNPSLILMGEVGAGKTHLAIATANKLLSKYNVKYVLYDEIKELRFYLTKREILDEKIRMFKETPILFIDDFFKNLHKVNDYEKIKSEIEVVYEIINYRYNQKKPLIITTELNINQLMKVDKAIASRILEMARDYRISFDGIELNYRIFGE